MDKQAIQQMSFSCDLQPKSLLYNFYLQMFVSMFQMYQQQAQALLPQVRAYYLAFKEFFYKNNSLVVVQNSYRKIP